MTKKNIITGQQIGLLGGPLYSTYKVLGAISLARELDGNAIYWLETNDADFNEINHIDYLDREGELQTLIWDIDSKGYSCGYIEIDKKLIELLHTFFDTIYQTEYTETLKKIVFESYQIGKTLAEASKSLARHLFGKYPLEIFDPSDREFRIFSKEILLNEAEICEIDQQCNFFCLDNKKRRAVFKRENGLYLRDGNKINISDFDLLPNVKTRNLCQDAYFKTHTYIAGPGEIKYIKELDPYYKRHGFIKSRVQPRMSVDILEPRIKRLLKKTDLTLTDLDLKTKVSVLKEALVSGSGFDKDKVTKNLNRGIDDFLKTFEDEGLDPGKLRKMLQQETKKIIGEKRKEIKLAFENQQKNIEQVFNHLKPFEKKQERVFNIFYYMNLYGGIGLIDFLFNRYDVENKIVEVVNG